MQDARIHQDARHAHTSRCKTRAYIKMQDTRIHQDARRAHTSRCKTRAYIKMQDTRIHQDARHAHTSRCKTRAYIKMQDTRIHQDARHAHTCRLLLNLFLLCLYHYFAICFASLLWPTPRLLNCNVLDEEDGTYRMVYTPQVRAPYTLSVFLDGQHIKAWWFLFLLKGTISSRSTGHEIRVLD